MYIYRYKPILTASLVCQPSSRFPWMKSALNVSVSPFSEYSSPNNKCCDSTNPETAIDFNGNQLIKCVY